MSEPFQPPLASRFHQHLSLLTYSHTQLTELETYYTQQLQGDLSDEHIDQLMKELQETDERLQQLREEERIKKERVKTEAEGDRLEAQEIRDIIRREGIRGDDTSEYDEENPENE